MFAPAGAQTPAVPPPPPTATPAGPLMQPHYGAGGNPLLPRLVGLPPPPTPTSSNIPAVDSDSEDEEDEKQATFDDEVALPTYETLRRDLLSHLTMEAAFATRDAAAAASLTRKARSWLHQAEVTNATRQAKLIADVLPVAMALGSTEAEIIRSSTDARWQMAHVSANMLAAGRIPTGPPNWIWGFGAGAAIGAAIGMGVRAALGTTTRHVVDMTGGVVKGVVTETVKNVSLLHVAAGAVGGGLLGAAYHLSRRRPVFQLGASG